jgi:hypothetical protein
MPLSRKRACSEDHRQAKWEQCEKRRWPTPMIRISRDFVRVRSLFVSHYLDIEHSPLAISSGLRIYCTPNVLSRAELGGNH